MKHELRRRLIAMILCVAMVAMLAGCSQNGGEQTVAPPAETGQAPAEVNEPKSEVKGEVKIGVFVFKTGPQPLDGDGGTKGAQMAADEINAAGGVNGYKLVLQFEDDANDANTTMNVATKFASDESILGMLGIMSSSYTVAISDIVKDYKIPMLQGGGSITIDKLENPYLFRFRLADSFVARVAANYMINTLGAKNIGVLYSGDDYGTGAFQVITSYLDTLGMKVTASEAHNRGDTDMTAGLLKLKDAGCDGIIVWSHGAECAIICRQYRELEMDTVPILGGPGFVNAAFYAGISDPAISNGTYCTADWSLDNPNQAPKDFVKRYTELYGTNPNTAASFWYDAVMIMADALGRCDEMTRENLYNELFNVGKDQELILNCGSVYCDENRNLDHEVIIGQNQDNVLQVITSLKESEF